MSGSTATVAGVCPSGYGPITSQGSGNSAQWLGSFTCPPVALGTCPAVALTYQNANVTLNSNGTLTANGSGVASGCSAISAVTLTFNGSK